MILYYKDFIFKLETIGYYTYSDIIEFNYIMSNNKIYTDYIFNENKKIKDSEVYSSVKIAEYSMLASYNAKKSVANIERMKKPQ